MDVGKIIKKARLEKGYTQEELAEKVGVKKSAVAKWENGRVSEIKRSNLKMLADTLEINPVRLLGEIEENPIGVANELSEFFLNPEYRELVAKYAKLNKEEREKVKSYIEFLGAQNGGR